MLASGAKTMKEILGKSDFDMYPPELAQTYWADDQKVLNTQCPSSIMKPGLDEKGTPVWIMTSKIPVKDAKGEVAGLVGIGRDITHQKNIELEIKRQKQFYETLISNSPGCHRGSGYGGKDQFVQPVL